MNFLEMVFDFSKRFGKLILKTKAYQNIEEHDNILNFRELNRISIKNVNELVSKGTKIHYG